MKPAAFDYVRIEHPEEALAHLAQLGEDARILAGGQSLLPILNMRLAQPKVLLDISGCRALDSLRLEGDHLAVGAATTQAGLEWNGEASRHVPLLAQAMPHIAHFQIRNRGTVCGSIAHADPSAELPLCLVALEGEVVLRSRRGQRVLSADAFFRGMLLTARLADELVTEVRFPTKTPGTGYAFEEFSLRHGDYAVVAAAAVVDARRIRLSIGGVADWPRSAQWPALAGEALDDALNEFAWSLQAREDAQASAKVRRHLIRHLGRQTIERARLAASAPEHASAGDALARIPIAPVPARPPARATVLNAGERRSVSLQVNGRDRTGDAHARTLLTDFLRHGLGLTGTHVGCEHGVCGACTVRIDGVAQRACLTLAVQAEGRTLQTVECSDEMDTLLARLRAAFKRHHALQCGYCTAGILMSCVDYLARARQPGEAEIRAMLSGHLCRCTGYTPIVQAVLEVARNGDGHHA